MGLFNRKKNSNDAKDDQNGEHKKEKGSWRRPANTAFKQQRLKAWQPILTPKTVLPTLFIIGIIFAPIGGLLLWGSSLVSEMTFDYTNCWNLTNSTSITELDFQPMPSYSYNLRSSDSGKTVPQPSYAYFYNATAPPSQMHVCVIQFDIVADLRPPVLQYYMLTNFYQNNRRYVSSLDTAQLQGQYVSPSSLSGSTSPCDPLATTNDGKVYYPCGLIANSMFNDTISGLTAVNQTAATYYNFSHTGIAWPGEAKKYSATSGYVGRFNETMPPPNWMLRYPDGYSEATPPPDLTTDEHFQNWMRTAGLPTFTKLYGRNDTTTLNAGQYQVQIYYNYPVQAFKGTKSLVISTVSWIGGKNPFLGWAYVATAALFVLLALAGTIRHLFKPRRLGDMSLLSWNR